MLQAGNVDGSAPPHALQRRIDPSALHHPQRQGRVEGRERQRAVLEDLHQLPAHTEQQHRPELRVDARSDDDLVACPLDHRLHRHALDVGGARAFAYRFLDGPVGRAHLLLIREV